jgi:hypothetical protein
MTLWLSSSSRRWTRTGEHRAWCKRWYLQADHNCRQPANLETVLRLVDLVQGGWMPAWV